MRTAVLLCSLSLSNLHLQANHEENLQRVVTDKLFFFFFKNQEVYFAALFLVTKERRQFIHQQERTKYILVHAENGSHEPEEAEARGGSLQVQGQPRLHNGFQARLDYR